MFLSLLKVSSVSRPKKPDGRRDAGGRESDETASRCLRPGGRILLTVPFAARWHYIPYDYWRFTPSSLLYLLNNAGFASVAVSARGNAATVASYKLLALPITLPMPQGKSAFVGLLLRLLGLPFIPLCALLALAGNLSLSGQGGDDCIGYTVIATKANLQMPRER